MPLVCFVPLSLRSRINKSILAVVVANIFCVIAVSIWFVTLEERRKPRNVEAVRKGNAKKCEELQCISKWLEQNVTDGIDFADDLVQNCKGSNQLQIINKTYHHYLKGEVDLSFYRTYYRSTWYIPCHEECGFFGPFHFYSHWRELDLQYGKYSLRNMNFSCFDRFRFPQGLGCRMQGILTFFQYTVSHFSILSTFILTVIDLSIMRQALKIMPGPALYFHMAEIVTDALLNITVSLGFSFFDAYGLYYWALTCGYFTHVFNFRTLISSAGQTYFFFVNQLFLTGIISDRLYALARSFQYDALGKSGDLRKRGKKLTILIFLCSFLFFFPYFVFNCFYPIFFHWHRTNYSSFWKNEFDTVRLYMRVFYTMIAIPLIPIQIIAGIMVERKYRRHKSNRVSDENRNEVKQQERDKQMLLVGTIGVNIITSVISGGIYMTTAHGFYKLFGIEDIRKHWTQPLLQIISYLLTFLNGNAALLFHLMFVKSYLLAFKKTKLGRLLLVKKVQPAQGQGQQAGPNQGQGQQAVPNQGQGQQVGPNQGPGQQAGPNQGQGQQAVPNQGQGQLAVPNQCQGQQSGTGRDQEQNAGTSIGQEKGARTIRDQGHHAGTSRGQGQQTGTSRVQGKHAGTSRGRGQQTGTSRGQGQQAGTSRGQGKQAGTSRGQGKQAGTSRGQGQQAGTSREQGKPVTNRFGRTTITAHGNASNWVDEH